MAEGRRLPNSVRTDRVELDLAPEPASLSAARQALERLDLPPKLLDNAKLLASELVTNAIKHAGLSPGDVIRLTATWNGGRLRVVVRHRVSAPASNVVGAIRPSPGAESGWGLFIVDRVAARWGTNLGGRPGYWFELIDEPGSDPG
jgi:anti-sigma regulatory factor (Ser/Thr protein kinase)